LPSLGSGNPFRRFPSGSSQQTTSLRYEAAVCVVARGVQRPF
jgi:hypothetical protein